MSLYDRWHEVPRRRREWLLVICIAVFVVGAQFV